MIVENRPYVSMKDFYNKMQALKSESEENKFGDVAMLTLIKAGCFDELEKKNRKEIIKDFIDLISPDIKILKMSNIEELFKMGLLNDAQKSYELRLYRFRKYLFQKKFFVKQTGKSPTTAYYKLDHKFAEPYFYENFETYLNENKDYEYNEDGFIIVKRGSIDKVYNKLTKDFQENILTNPEYIKKFNEKRKEEIFNSKISGNISQWEMDSLCFYYTKHELENVDKKMYSIVDFWELSKEPEITDHYFYRGQMKPRFKLNRIIGTVIDKNKDKHTVSLLTLNGVVEIKFYKGQFNFYDKQIAEIQEDGSKKVREKSWFSRGQKILVTGFRREEQFIPKNYKDSIFKHSVQLIKDINQVGELELQSERFGQDEEFK